MESLVGKPAPDFELPDQHGKPVRLSDFRGRWVVLYFYPKDMTPGCTQEACAFRDNFAEFEREGIVVLGVSADSVRSHQKFAEKYGLPFPLLADESHQVSEAYGAWQQKSMYGKTYWGVARITFIIDPSGVVRHVFPKVSPAGHAQEVLAVLRALRDQS